MEERCPECGLPLELAARRRCWPKGVSVQTCWKCKKCGQTAWGIPDFDERDLSLRDLIHMKEERRKRKK